MGVSIRVLVVEDDRAAREGLAARLGAHAEVRVAGVVEVGEGAGAARLLARHPGSLVVLVSAGAGEGAVRLVERLREEAPSARVVAMDVGPGGADVAALVRAGAAGFVLSDATGGELVSAVRAVAAGEAVLPFSLTGTLLSHIAGQPPARPPARRAGVAPMTNREREVLLLIDEGLSNREIGRRLHLATHTVKGHVHRILAKLALRTRLQVAAHGRRHPAEESARTHP